MGGLFASREWTVGSDTRVLQELGCQELPAYQSQYVFESVSARLNGSVRGL